MRHLQRVLLITVAACLPHVAAAQTIQPVFLNLPGNFGLAVGVNQSGQVIGSYQDESFQLVNFIWQNGTVAPLQNAENRPRIMSINNNGAVLFETSGPDNPAVWVNGLVTELRRPTLSGIQFGVAGFNDNLEAVGDSLFNLPNDVVLDARAFHWLNLTSPPVSVAPLLPLVQVHAAGINNIGQIIVNTPNVYPYSFLKDPGGSLRPIVSKVLGSGGKKAFALNDSGQVVGTFTDSSTFVSHAFLWQNGVAQDLGLPPGATDAEAQGVDSTGRVLVSAGSSCWVWKSGTYLNLASAVQNHLFGTSPSCGSIANVGTGAIVAGNALGLNGSAAAIWNVP